jgi:cell filamentation protein
MAHDPYVYPGTDVLRNAPGIRDPDELRAVEADLTQSRASRFADTPLPGRYDLAHLQDFHRALFEGLYEWAGELRTVAIAKSELFCLPQHIHTYGHDIFTRLAREDRLRGLDRDRFLDRLAHYLGEINALHPFREGNGRTQRAFLGQLAREAGYRIHWQHIDPDRNIEISIAAMRGDEKPLRGALQTITTPVATQPKLPAWATDLLGERPENPRHAERFDRALAAVHRYRAKHQLAPEVPGIGPQPTSRRELHEWRKVANLLRTTQRLLRHPVTPELDTGDRDRGRDRDR